MARRGEVVGRSGRIGAGDRVVVFGRHCEERKRRSNPAFCLSAAKLDCFASLAMTGGAGCLKREAKCVRSALKIPGSRLRAPRNDGLASHLLLPGRRLALALLLPLLLLGAVAAVAAAGVGAEPAVMSRIVTGEDAHHSACHGS